MTRSGPTLAPAPGPHHGPGTGANTGPLTFFLGTHQPGWLSTTPVPLFISDRRLRAYKTFPCATGPWALDSGGFTELSQYGTWDQGPAPEQYVRHIRRYRDQIGYLAWAAPQDWMCEPFITAKTGLTVTAHQHRTVDNLVLLRGLAPELPIIPVLQGWTILDYLRCISLYERAGINLTTEPLVGLGSVCRRQATTEIAVLIATLHTHGIKRLHGFGFKTSGLTRCGHLLASADSMAWSFAARRQPPLPGCQPRHNNCANCPRYAYQWHTRICASLATQLPAPLTLFDIWAGESR